MQRPDRATCEIDVMGERGSVELSITAPVVTPADQRGAPAHRLLADTPPSVPPADQAGDTPAPVRYRPDIDGLRALAILPILLLHCGVAGLRGGFVRVDSQVKYAVLARGEAEVYLRPQSKPSWRDQAWDHVAGVAVAGEAGATCTDQDGKALDFSHGRRLEANRGILTTNGPLHGAIVEAIRRAEVR